MNSGNQNRKDRNRLLFGYKRGDDILKRMVFISVGSICVGLGLIGIFLPILPTTPFLLVASACYLRASEKCHRWLLHNKFFGNYIRNYIEGKGIPLKTKVLTISILWLSIQLSISFSVSGMWGKISLLTIAVAVTAHLILVKTHKPC